MNHSMSDEELYRILGPNTRILTYSELQHERRLSDVLGPDKRCVLLFENHPHGSEGHWVCVFEDGKGQLQFFDSLGLMPDRELKWVEYQYPVLSKLLAESMRPVRYNQYRLQSTNPHVRTCGKWVAVRLMLQHLDEDQFRNFVDTAMKLQGLTNRDAWVNSFWS